MTVLHRLLAPARDQRTLLALAFVASGLPLGIAWFVLLVTGWSLGLGLAITLLGLPILIALGAACHGAAALERTLANSLLGAGARRPAKRPVPRGILARLRDWVADPAVWRAQAYMLLRFVLGLPAAVAVLALASAGGGLVALPFYYWTGDVEVVAVWDVDTIGEALLVVPVGLAVLAVGVPWLLRGIAAAWTPLARALLDGRPPAPAAAPAAPLPAGRRALAVQASVTAALVLGLVAIWAATAPGGYFWPAWPLLALALLLGGHALVVLRRPGVPRNRRGLEIHAGLAALVNLFLIGVWLLSTPGDYFWPIWTIVGLGAPVAVHAGLVLLGATEREGMADRIDVLTATRSGAVDAQAAELRRIERDLHDGAQARLVALAMDLGMAREKLGADPQAAEALVGEAHEGAKRALTELRDLARGIHPVVLTDRGLEAALGSLAGTGHLPVDLEVALEGRLPPAIEAAAYFIVAESLANAAKHSEAARVRVRVERAGDRLLVEVADDGRGGADPAGEGLVGLRRRVEALDGRLTVGDGPDGGSIVRAELPCGVVIAEDLALLRDGIVRLLRDNGFEVVAAVEEGEALVAAVEEHRPDVAVVDVRLPPTFQDEGLRAALEARRRVPGTAVLVVSQYVEQTYALELMADGRGAVGYLLKDRIADPADFVEAVRRVASGGTAMDQEVVLQLVARRSRGGRLDELTAREREVLTLMAEGRSNAAIAGALVVTEGAVEKHISNIFGKLGLAPSDEDHRRVLAVLAYLRAG